MKILSLNSAFLESNIAFSDGKNERFIKLDSSLKHSENMLREIENILDNTKVEELDYIGAIIGPGSFTGIRIGISIAKAFMSVYPNIKAVPINSLEFLAYSYLKENKQDKDFYCVLNALSGNYYIAKYNKDGEEVVKPYLADSKELLNIYENNNNVVGLYGEEIGANALVEFKSEVLLELTKKKIQEKKFTDENQLLPLYLRLSQAEQQLKEKQ